MVYLAFLELYSVCGKYKLGRCRKFVCHRRMKHVAYKQKHETLIKQFLLVVHFFMLHLEMSVHSAQCNALWDCMSTNKNSTCKC